jgi:yersiniabactin nonribosomal peptide synthetase
MDTARNSPLDSGGLRRAVAELLAEDADHIGPDDDLLRMGLDSLRIMRLAAQLRKAGVQVSFGDLIGSPTLAAWTELACGPEPAQESTADPTPGGPVVVESEPFDLAPMQHAYWIGRADGQQLGGVGAHFYNEFDGPGVDATRLDDAVRALIARHGMLRARFTEDGRQVIDPVGAWPGLTVRDLRGLDPDALDGRLAGLRDLLSHRRLAVQAGEVFDIQFTRLPGGECRVHVNIEMLVADAHSFRLLMSDLAALYRYPDRPLPAIDYSFPRYLAQIAATDQDDPARARARRYWTDRLDELPGAPELPLTGDPAALAGARTVRRHHWLDARQWQALGDRARRHGVTLAMVFATAYAEVLGAWSAQPRFLLNLPLYSRQPRHADVGRLVGDFTSLVLLPVDLTEQRTFAERVKQVQAEFQDCVSHAEYSGLDVLRDLARSRSDRQAGAPVVFTSALNLGELFGEDVRESFGAPVWTMSQTPQVWLDQQVTEREGGLYLNWDAVDGMFADGVLDGMFDTYRSLLDWLLDTDWDRLAPDPLPDSQRAVRAAVNATDRPRRDRGLHEDFFAVAAEHPERTALAWGLDDDARELSYGDLAGQALRIAAALVAHGVRPGEPVAVTLPKGADQVRAVLGVLAAGGTYVPVGVEQPAARRERIHRGAGVALVLTDERSRDDVGGLADVTVLTVADALRAEPAPSALRAWPESPAYLIFTSGSTGEPKGVAVPHRAAVNTIDAIDERWRVCADDRVLAVSALDFDLSVYDIFGLLSVGGTTVLIDGSTRRDAAAWVRLVRRWGVTVWQSVPALLDMLLSAADVDDLGDSLRLALLGGDWVGLDLAPRLAAHAPGSLLVALGGTTETAIHSTVQEVTDVPAHWVSVPYGVPLPNQRLRVADQCGRDRPDWVPGELWIGGDSVAIGYRNDLERTARQFVRHDGVSFYRTGDLARYWPDGTVEFLGRADHQVKIRGHRIELGEVEAAVRSHPAVTQAVVTTAGTAGRRLVAVVGTGTDPETLPAQRVRAHLTDRLPAYMVPDQVVVLTALPLSANGKIDRKAIAALLAEHADGPSAAKTEPVGELETLLAGVWRTLLDAEEVGRDDSFFALGGDSLLATRMLPRLGALGVCGARLRTLFDNPVLRAFATTLSLGDGPADRPAVLVADPAHRHEPFPATDVQMAYWLGRSDDFTLGGTGTTWYTEFDSADVDVDRLQDAWNALVARHEMLRAVFDDAGRQRILPEVPRYRIQVARPDPADETAALARLREDLSHLFLDARRWPLFDLRAVRTADGHTRIGVCLDYLVFDALSIMTVFSELGRLYREPSAELPSIGLSFRDYVLGVHPDPERAEAARRYWTERLPELPHGPELPLRVDPATVRAPRFARREAVLPAAVWQAIGARARAHELTASTVLATAYAEVLAAWSGRCALSVVFTLFDRADVHPDIDVVLGDFTSLLVVDHRAEQGDGWADTARRLQDRVWSALEHRSTSAVWVLREMAKRAGLDQVTVPVVFTSTLGVADERIDLDLSFGERVWGLSQTPQVWLDHQVAERDGELVLTWDAVEELFSPGVLDAMFDAYVGLVTRLADVGTDWTRPTGALLPPDQRAVRAAVNATDGPAGGGLLHDGFFATAAAHPDRVALCWGEDGSLTYGDLADRALRIASSLRERGVGEGCPVAVTLPKGADQIAGVLGVLAAGGAYVTGGGEQPALRRDRIYRGAGTTIALTDLDVPDGVMRLGMAEALLGRPLSEPVAVDPASLAYVIYTSGSTGEPKGVEIAHRAAVNTIDEVDRRWDVGADDRVLAVSALDFDLSVYDVFGLLAVGGAVVLIEEDSRRDAVRWLDLATRHGVTVWNTVPALLDMLLVAAEDRALPAGLRLAMVSGDWVGLDLPGRLATASGGACRLVALGGATEAAIWSNAFEVDGVPEGWTSIPYGLPLRNQRFRVVDPRGRDCPDWVAGELWIGGAGVAEGYRGDPDRTRERFVAHDGLRWYRTGDLGRYRPDGLLEFLGRADHQVKVRGHRIELGEIEAAVEVHPGVLAAVAVAVGERTRRLALAVVGDVDVAALRVDLAGRVPGYMVPEQVLVFEEFPLSDNGKVDRRAITDRLVQRPADDLLPPVGPLEEAVAQLWVELLEPGAVGREQSFFGLGGDSLLATRLAEAIRRRFGVRLRLRQLFRANTVATQAELIHAEDEHVLGADVDVEEGVL